MKTRKSLKKTDRKPVENCGNRKRGGCAFEWTCKDFVKEVKARA